MRLQEVARAFRRGGRQDRRRIFGEADIGHLAAHGGDDLGALDDVLVQRLAAQVEEAVLEADVFRVVRLAEDRQRQFLRRRQHLNLLGVELDLAGRHVLVDGVVGARLDEAVDADHPFAADRLGQFEGRAVGIGDDLGHAVVVAQVDEEDAAMVADTVNPAGETNGGADIGLPQGGTGVAAVTVHEMYPGITCAGATLEGSAGKGKSGGKAHGAPDLSRRLSGPPANAAWRCVAQTAQSGKRIAARSSVAASDGQAGAPISGSLWSMERCAWPWTCDQTSCSMEARPSGVSRPRLTATGRQISCRTANPRSPASPSAASDQSSRLALNISRNRCGFAVAKAR